MENFFFYREETFFPCVRDSQCQFQLRWKELRFNKSLVDRQLCGLRKYALEYHDRLLCDNGGVAVLQHRIVLQLT